MQKHGKKIKLTISGCKKSGQEILDMFTTTDTKHGKTRHGVDVNSPAYKRIGTDVVILGKAGTLKKGFAVMTIDDFSVLGAHANGDPVFTGATATLAG